MRIKEVNIQRYGTLRPFHAKFQSNVSIIFGPGGSGKTLIIDAILRMLLGRDGSKFVRHKEVDETPAGYIVVEKEGKEFKLGDKRRLSDIPGLELAPTELKNIFVIEDADLEISHEDEFYGRVTDKLIGVRTEDIGRIRHELLARGRLAPKLELLDKHPHKVRTKLNDAKKLRDNIREYVDKARSEGIDKLEKEKLDLRWSLKRSKETIELLEKAKKKSEFDRLEAAFDEAKKNSQALGEFPDKNRISALQGRLSNFGEDEERRPRLEREIGSWKEQSKYLLVSTVVAFAVVAIFGFGLISLILPFILFLTFLVSLYEWLQCDRGLAQLETTRRLLLKDAQQIVRTRVVTVEEAEEEITRISKEREEKEATFNQKKGILAKDLQIDERDPGKFMQKAEDALAKLRQKIDPSTPVEYDGNKLEEQRVRQESERQRLEEIEKQLQKHQKAIQVFSDNAQQLPFTDEFSDFTLDFQVANLWSLDELVRWLGHYIERIEKDAELSREAYRIFEELESREKAKSEELFGKRNPASKIFRRITSGMFEEVKYDSSSRAILVTRSQGKKLQKASELSRGEWTQLYTAIRMALGQELLKGEKGFFIVEEPFIHADSERLLNEFDMLKRLSKAGWQTIYFTAKDEIKTGLPKQMDVDIIELQRLP
ncbi:AAA family ATPase [Candidatus Bathyarchaeota archaeon]|nr:AAA family ATPase [Candidatus Bathyarchaeota archaeon]